MAYKDTKNLDFTLNKQMALTDEGSLSLQLAPFGAQVPFQETHSVFMFNLVALQGSVALNSWCVEDKKNKAKIILNS